MRGSTFLGRYATSTDSSSGDFPEPPPAMVAFHWTNRAGGDAMRAPFVIVIGVDQGLQFFCGWSRLPVRVEMETDPPLRLASKLRRPHCEYMPESKTSLSIVPS